MFSKKFTTLVYLLCFNTFLFAQQAPKTIINYILRIDTSDLSGYDVEMHIQNPPKSFHLAMATHKEYDDRYWRFAEYFTVESKQKINFIREDSALWKIISPGKDATIKYRIHLPASNGQRPVWRPFLSATGGLVGDLHSFMYMVEQLHTPSHITVQLPQNWKIATGLTTTNDPTIFYAPSSKALMDCPVMIGKFYSWNFTVKGVPHQIVYWPLPNAISFDTSLLINNVKKIVTQTVKLFDIMPYKKYIFLFQDDAYGALEHSNSVTVGIPSINFQRDIVDMNQEIAHEYFHTWNLMALRPAEYSELNYGPQEKAGGLWWSEGMSIFYSDLLLRRSGIATYDSTRTIHLEKLIERYFSNPGNAKISPVKSSLESNAPPGGLGDYSVSVHLQGEVVGAMLDLITRDATNGEYSIDNVMRKMFYRFPEKKGFYSADIEKAVKDICGCDVHFFFEKYVYNANEIDFNKYLKLIGRQVNVTWKQATDESGKPMPDYQMNIYKPVGDTGFNILIFNAESCWAKAGLHTNDKVISINDMPVTGQQTWRNIVRNLKIGDNIKFIIKRNQVIKEIIVNVTGRTVATAQITALVNITTKQQKIFTAWNNSK